MKVLYVSRSSSGKPHAFVQEQAEVLMKNYNIHIEHFLITRGGAAGYGSAVIQLFNFIRKNRVDIIHVHYGLSALVAVLNKLIPFNRFRLVITYHGSDINQPAERRFSLLAAKFSAHNILVSEKMLKYFKHNYSVVPCGVDTDIKLGYRDNTRIEMGWTENDFVVLFSSDFGRKEKDPQFAFQVIDAFAKASTQRIHFIELKGYSRGQLTRLMQAADALILCSEREGSPQVIKEAILNALPVVANDVGDVALICSGIDNCFIVPKQVSAYVNCLQVISQQNVRIQNRAPMISRFDNNLISEKLFNIYSQVLR